MRLTYHASLAGRWFGGGPAFDAEVRAALLTAHEAAAAGALDGWRDSVLGALAWIILMDQVPRNVFRGTPAAFVEGPYGESGSENLLTDIVAFTDGGLTNVALDPATGDSRLRRRSGLRRPL